jgi:hypothetical protein
MTFFNIAIELYRAGTSSSSFVGNGSDEKKRDCLANKQGGEKVSIFGRARCSVRAAACQPTHSAGKGLPALPVLPSLFVKGIIPIDCHIIIPPACLKSSWARIAEPFHDIILTWPAVAFTILHLTTPLLQVGQPLFYLGKSLH